MWKWGSFMKKVKAAKRPLSMLLSLVVLISSLFVTIPFAINAGAAKNDVIYFERPSIWTDTTVYIHVWENSTGSAETGTYKTTKMTSLGGNIYSYKITSDNSDRCLFVNEDETCKTKDLELSGGNKIYKITNTSNKTQLSGSWSSYTPPSTGGGTTSDSGSYQIVGSGFTGATWETSSAKNLSYSSAYSRYEVSLSGLTVGSTNEYKLIRDRGYYNDFSEAFGLIGENNLSFKAYDTTCTVWFKPKKGAKTYTYGTDYGVEFSFVVSLDGAATAKALKTSNAKLDIEFSDINKINSNTLTVKRNSAGTTLTRSITITQYGAKVSGTYDLSKSSSPYSGTVAYPTYKAWGTGALSNADANNAQTLAFSAGEYSMTAAKVKKGDYVYNIGMVPAGNLTTEAPSVDLTTAQAYEVAHNNSSVKLSYKVTGWNATDRKPVGEATITVTAPEYTLSGDGIEGDVKLNESNSYKTEEFTQNAGTYKVDMKLGSDTIKSVTYTVDKDNSTVTLSYSDDTDELTADIVPPEEPEPSDKATYGDLNSDKSINSIDAYIVRKIAKKELTPDPIQKALADVDNSGDVDEEDVKLLNEYIVGIKREDADNGRIGDEYNQ